MEIKTRKGFVLTLDAIIALLVIFMSVAVTFSFIHQVRNYSPQSIKLRELSSDLLSVMEKNGYLEESVSDRTAVRSLLQDTPDGVCMMLEVTEGNSTIPTYAMQKTGCEVSTGKERVVLREEYVSWRSFVKDGEYYCAKITGWYK